MQKRKILLLEPGYKNKYPPIGLMKIATYHRRLRDEVIFYKGSVKKIVIDILTEKCINKLQSLLPKIEWCLYKDTIRKYIYLGHKSEKDNLLDEVLLHNNLKRGEKDLLDIWIVNFSDNYRKNKYQDEPLFDRVYISTLFTFYWNITVKTINDAKRLVDSTDNIIVGGVCATVLNDKLKKATGIIPFSGLIDKPGLFDNNNDLIVDELPLDYSILDEIDYNYPEKDAFFEYTTRGCIRKCSFCAVWKIEPKFKKYISIVDRIELSRKIYGDHSRLLLLDNNVLASPLFHKIIEDLKLCGFSKGAKYLPPNDLDITINNLKKGINDRAYIKKSFQLILDLLNRLSEIEQQKLYNLLEKHSLLKLNTTKKENILILYKEIKELYNNKRSKALRKRYVDFNQGIDARLVTEKNMKLLSEICISPLRIAFDSMKYKDVYIKAVELAVKNRITVLSNYLLYNEDDKPNDLYHRLKINIFLAEKHDIIIYSFPMKYHPINGKDYLNRKYLGKYWNRKYIRAIQTVLNSTKGKVGRIKSFFYKAFGKNIKEYNKILLMPETYILYRYFFEDLGCTDKWWTQLNAFNKTQKRQALKIIKANDFSNPYSIKDSIIKSFIIEHYCISKKDIETPGTKLYKEKQKYELHKSKIQAKYNKITSQIASIF